MRSRTASREAAVKLREQLVRGIRDARWKPGDRLPTERELAARHDAARSAVRKVLAELGAQGLITRTAGRGTEVAGAPAPNLPETQPDTSPAELMEARLLFEPMLAELAVRNATGADLKRMEECLERAKRASSMAEFEDWDDALHRAIAAATHNGFLVRVYQQISASRWQTAWGRLKQRSWSAARRAAYQAEHRRIVVALKQRDVGSARARIAEHLRHVGRDLLEN